MLLMAGAQVPTMLLMEVVGNAGMEAPLQYGPTCVKVGVMLPLTVMVALCAVTGFTQDPTPTLTTLQVKVPVTEVGAGSVTVALVPAVVMVWLAPPLSVQVKVYGAVEFDPVKVMLGCAPFSQTVVVPEMMALGNCRIEVTIVFDVPLQPAALTTTEKVPALFTVIDCVVSPELHK